MSSAMISAYFSCLRNFQAIFTLEIVHRKFDKRDCLFYRFMNRLGTVGNKQLIRVLAWALMNNGKGNPGFQSRISKFPGCLLSGRIAVIKTVTGTLSLRISCICSWVKAVPNAATPSSIPALAKPITSMAPSTITSLWFLRAASLARW